MPGLGVLDRRLKYVAEAHRTESFQERNPPAEETWGDTCHDASRQLVGRQPSRVQRLRRGTGRVERVDLAARVVKDRHESVAAGTGHHRLDEIEGSENGDGGICGCATLQEDSDPGH